MNKDLIRSKVEYIVIFIAEFGKKHRLSGQQAYQYLKQFGAIDLIDSYYDVMHTQSFSDTVKDVTAYCHRKGGVLQ